jgi:hypothetical protein
VAGTVFILGAGFNYSVMGPGGLLRPPLATNFFQVLLGRDRWEQQLDGIRRNIDVDVLFEEIERYWKLSAEQLRTAPFDIEECLTLFESQIGDQQSADRVVALRRAGDALRNLLLMHLAELSHGVYTPVTSEFGKHVLGTSADVVTFNYDTIAENAIASASGIGPKLLPSRYDNDGERLSDVADEDLDASHFSWRRPLAYGFRFDEVALPVAGVSRFIEGERYYGHPANELYTSMRVLKVHGSIDWLMHTGIRDSPLAVAEKCDPPPAKQLVLTSYGQFWMGGTPTHNRWRMEPVVVPPQLYKRFDMPPFPDLWDAASGALADCETLIVVGYSFPPTDFRSKRLLLEAFADHSPREVVVVNPDTSVAGLVRRVTHFGGPIVSCDSLGQLYGVGTSYF